MMRSMDRWLGGTVGAALVLLATTASAQVIGTFSWQLAPHCNVVTLTVEQVGPTFRVHGFDDQCGAAERASASGAAHLNPNGTVGLAFVVTRSDGLTMPASARINIATVSGTWADEFANSGTFVFTPTAPATGAPRRVTLTGTILLTQRVIASESVAASFSFGRTLAAAPAAAGVIRLNQSPTADCPGSAVAPSAAPGRLCVYERFSSNVNLVGIIASEAIVDRTDRSGAGITVNALAAGSLSFYGRWAVTIP